MVLGALGGAPGGIWAPRWPKAQKNTQKTESVPAPLGTSGEPKFEKNAIGVHFLTFFCRYFSSLDFSTILGDFRLRN